MKLAKLGLSKSLLDFLLATRPARFGIDDERLLAQLEKADVARFAVRAEMDLLEARMADHRLSFAPPSDGVWAVETIHDGGTRSLHRTPEGALKALATLEEEFQYSHEWAAISKILLVD